MTTQDRAKERGVAFHARLRLRELRSDAPSILPNCQRLRWCLSSAKACKRFPLRCFITVTRVTAQLRTVSSSVLTWRLRTVVPPFTRARPISRRVLRFQGTRATSDHPSQLPARCLLRFCVPSLHAQPSCLAPCVSLPTTPLPCPRMCQVSASKPLCTANELPPFISTATGTATLNRQDSRPHNTSLSRFVLRVRPLDPDLSQLLGLAATCRLCQQRCM